MPSCARTGAAISASEFNNAKTQYFPQPGDSEQARQKKANREMAIKGFRSRRGRGKHIGGGLEQAQQSGPKVGTSKTVMCFKVAIRATLANWKAVQ